MIKATVINRFTINKDSIKKYGKIKAIEKAVKEKENEYDGKDVIECTEEMARYLEKDNDYTKKTGKPLVKVIEIIPEEKKEEIKPITRRKRRK